MSSVEVASVPDSIGRYDARVARTPCLELESPDWEREPAGDRHTDVNTPAALTVDGVTSRDVGVRGNNSFHGRGDGAAPDPVVALDDPRKALRRTLLAVPALRTRHHARAEMRR